jgi:YHS domain-containing protein
MGGLDFVQYFSFVYGNETGVRGSEEYSVSYNSYEFYFINDENKALFESDPEKYIPQYGGEISSLHH